MINEAFIHGVVDEIEKQAGLLGRAAGAIKKSVREEGAGRTIAKGVTHPLLAARGFGKGFKQGLTGQHKKDLLEATLAKRRHRLKYGRKT